MTYEDVVHALRSAGCVFAEDEATLLIDAGGDVAALVARRVAGEPLEQVVGWADLCGLRIEVDPGVFVPRRRTALLARRAASLATPGAVVVDLCCGSGAVGAVVRATVPDVDLHAADVMPAAVACARRNLGAQVYEGDLFGALPEELRGKVDVLVANAPYVPTGAIAHLPAEAREHEPRETLDGGYDGLEVLRRIVAGAGKWLSADGRLLFECGRDQVDGALTMLDGWLTQVAVDDDLQATVVIAGRA